MVLKFQNQCFLQLWNLYILLNRMQSTSSVYYHSAKKNSSVKFVRLSVEMQTASVAALTTYRLTIAR